MSKQDRISEPVQPVEAIVRKYDQDGRRAEVEFAPNWGYNATYIRLLDGISAEEVPVGSKISVDNANIGGAMGTIRAHDSDGRVIADNYPQQTYQRAEPITF